MKNSYNPINLQKFKLKNFSNMKQFKNLLKPNNSLELFLTVLLVIYIIFNVQTPNFLIPMLDNSLANIIIILIALYVFISCNPILGIIALVAAYFLIKRSTHLSPNYAMQHYVPSEENKQQNLSKYNENDFSSSLEEEIVDKIPQNVSVNSNDESNYKPVLDTNIESSNL